jgi:hypothetical protein
VAAGPLLGRSDLERAFTALGERLARRGVVDDLQALAGLASVTTVDEAVRICREFYPDEVMSPRSVAVLRELFEP